jgi:hypothetical protein
VVRLAKKLEISPDLSLPLEAVTWTFSVLAIKGSGKSNVLVVMAEEMHKAGLHWIALDPKGDWWGIQSSGDGKSPGLSVPIFGGEHGNVPLYPDSGPALADLLINEGISAVIDVSEFTKGEMSRFLGGPNPQEGGKGDGFFARLYKKKNRSQPPTHVFLEEVDEYLPQQVTKEIAKLHYDGQKIATKGRYRGLGVTCATQRPARFHNDVLTQTENLIAMRNLAPTERKQVKLWTDYHGQSKEIVDSLPSLDDGEAWVVSPQKLKIVKRVRFRRRSTFDSGATPDVVVRGKRRPPTLADINLPAIEESMAETIEKAKAEDPTLLRRRIAELEKQLGEKPKDVPAPAEPEVIEVPVFAPGELDKLYELTGGLFDRLNEALGQRHIHELLDTASRIHFKLDEVRGNSGAARSVLQPAPKPRAKPRPADPPARRLTSPPVPPPGRRVEEESDDVSLKAGARRILETYARHHPMKLTRSQLGTLAGFKITGGTFQTYFSKLKRHGFVEELGRESWITDEGFAHLGEIPPSPMTTEEIIERWRGVLKAGARAMLDVLIDCYPGEIARVDLATAVDMTESGGTFQTYLATLRRNGLAEVNASDVRASDTLFMAAAS